MDMDKNENDHISDADEELDAIESEFSDTPPCEESESKKTAGPIILNAQITKNYFKSMYGDDSPTEIIPRNSTSSNAVNNKIKPPFLGSPVKILTSPSKNPDILNSKVCPPIRCSTVTTSVREGNDEKNDTEVKCENKEDDIKHKVNVNSDVEEADNENKDDPEIEQDVNLDMEETENVNKDDPENEQEVAKEIEKEVQKIEKRDNTADIVDVNEKTNQKPDSKSITKTITMEEKLNLPPKNTFKVVKVLHKVAETNTAVNIEEVITLEKADIVLKNDDKNPKIDADNIEDHNKEVVENSETIEDVTEKNKDNAKEEEIKIILCDDKEEKPSEVTETPTPQPVKRKRGRPRKTPVPSDIGGTTATTPASTKSSMNETKNATEDNNDDDDNDTPSEPKVRRRKSKKVFYEYIEEPDSEPEPMETNQDKKKKLDSKDSETTPTPKKRGRPRKQPVDANEVIKKEEQQSKETPKKQDTLLDSSAPSDDNNATLSSSKRGRKRKKIDYFAMENSYYNVDDVKNTDDYDDEEIDNYSSEDSFDDGKRVTHPTTKATKTTKRRGRRPGVGGKSKQTYKPSSHDPLSDDDDDEAEKKTSKDNNAAGDDEFRLNVKNKQTMRTYARQTNTTTKIIKDNVVEGDADEQQQVVKKTLTPSTKSKAGRKPRTGETTEMLRKVFTAAVKTNTQQDSNATAAESSGGVNKADKNKDGDDNDSTINQDENDDDDDDTNQVKCVDCQKKMDSVDWDEHNLIEHYNLSWIEGATPLSLDDNSLRRKLLKDAITKLNQLECPKCDTAEGAPKIFETPNEYMQHTDACFGIILQGKVTCGVCSNEMDEQKWLQHKLKVHNNLAWRVGDKPLDLSNQSFVFFILNNLYKQKRPLYCYKCSVTKKSVLGFLSHQAQCGIRAEDAKVTCHLCHRKVLPVSMPSHLRLVHANKENDSKWSTFEKKPVDISVFKHGESKRKAAQKALKVINSITKEVLAPELKKHYTKQTTFEVKGSNRAILEKELQNKQTIMCKFTKCDYTVEDVDKYLEHMAMCDLKPEEFYLCKHCLLVTDTQLDMEEHATVYLKASKDETEYNINDDYNADGNTDADSEEGEEVDEEDLDEALAEERRFVIKKRKTDEKRSQADPNYKAIPTFITTICKRKNALFSCAFEYTLEFCNQHFTQSDIFTSLNYKINDWILVDHEEAVKYLPEIEESCKVARISTKEYIKKPKESHPYRTFELFEVEQTGDFTTIFCGGPINAMAWLPTPYIYLKCNQLLAVAVGRNFDGMYKVQVNYAESTAIQFWNFGIMKNKTQLIPKPTLMFCLAVDIGPIWHLEWCPSGCYSEKPETKDDEMKRQGLLAVAGSMPLVHIYAVPLLKEDQMELVYKVKPLLKLQLCADSSESKTSYFPTKIAWSKASGHQHIAVGYTNGMVGLYDLKSKSSLNKYKDEDSIDILLPYKVIKAHRYYITVLSMIHLRGGTRWLLTGSFDRNLTTWDLSNDTSTSSNRSRVLLDGVWMTNWMCSITGADTSNSRTLSSRLSSHREYLFRGGPALSSNTAVSAVSASDWLNGILQGNVAGDVAAMFPHQLLYCADNDIYNKYRFALSYTRLMDKYADKSAEKYLDKDSTKYETTIQRYNVLFCDMETDLYSAESETIRKEMLNNEDQNDPTVTVGAFNIRQINKLSFNPNCQASLYFATGYQVGFVRITYLRSLDSDKQVV